MVMWSKLPFKEMNLGRMQRQWTGLEASLRSSCSKEGQSPSPIVSIFLTISLYFTILLLSFFLSFFFDKLKKESSTVAVLHLRCCKDFGGFKAVRQEQGTSSPSRWWAWLSFLVMLARWKWFDMETHLICSIFAMVSGSLTRTLGSCFDEGIGRFHFPSVALISQTKQNSETMTSKSQLLSITNTTSSLKPSKILNPPPPSLKWSYPMVFPCSTWNCDYFENDSMYLLIWNFLEGRVRSYSS